MKSAPPYHPHINSSQSALSHHSNLNTFQTLHSHLAHTNNSQSAPPRYATAHHAKPFTPTPNAITSSTSPIPQHTKPRAHRAYDPPIINDTEHQPPRSHPNHPYLAQEHSRPIAPNDIAPIPTISSTHTGHHSEVPPSSPTKQFIYANIIKPTKQFIYANTTTLPPQLQKPPMRIQVAIQQYMTRGSYATEATPPKILARQGMPGSSALTVTTTLSDRLMSKNKRLKATPRSHQHKQTRT